MRTAVGWIFAAALAAGAPGAEAEILVSGEVGVEVEVFRERYRTGDLFEFLSDPEGSVDRVSESFVRNDASRISGLVDATFESSGSRAAWSLANSYAHGPQLLRDALDADLSLCIGPRRMLRFEDRLDVRHDMDGTQSYDQDLQHTARIEFEADSLAGAWRLRLREEISNSRVTGDSLGPTLDQDRSRMNLDLLRETAWGEWEAEGSLVHKEAAPGLTGTYREAGFGGRARVSGGLGLYGDADASSRRRIYLDPSLRGSSSWAHEAGASAGYDGAAGWSVEVSDEITLCRFDEPDDVYVDYTQNRATLRGRASLVQDLALEIAPAIETLRASDAQRYDQPSIELGLSVDSIHGWWLHLTQEVGRRDYGGGADSSMSVSFGGLDISLASTDYVFASSSLLGRMDLGRGTEIDLFLDYAIERHDGGEESFSLFTATTSLTRRF